jgi:hypothetical protein
MPTLIDLTADGDDGDDDPGGDTEIDDGSDNDGSGDRDTEVDDGGDDPVDSLPRSDSLADPSYAATYHAAVEASKTADGGGLERHDSLAYPNYASQFAAAIAASSAEAAVVAPATAVASATNGAASSKSATAAASTAAASAAEDEEESEGKPKLSRRQLRRLCNKRARERGNKAAVRFDTLSTDREPPTNRRD